MKMERNHLHLILVVGIEKYSENRFVLLSIMELIRTTREKKKQNDVFILFNDIFNYLDCLSLSEKKGFHHKKKAYLLREKTNI